MNRKRAATWLFASLLTSHAARAAEPAACGATDHPWVEVTLGADFPPRIAPFVELLRAELASRGIDVCAGRAPTATLPVATIEVEPTPGGVGLNVEVRDKLTAKRVSRDLDLGAIPADGQPLMVALASDELLRATWAELALRSAPTPSGKVPPAVTEIVRDSVGHNDAERVRFGAVGVAEYYSAGTALYGADLRFGVALARRLFADVGFGLRTGPTVSAHDGEIGVSAVAGSLSAAFTVTPPERVWGLDTVARFEVEHVALTPAAHAGAVGSPEAGYGVLADAGVGGFFRVLHRLRVSAEIVADVPVRAIYVTDAQVRVAGVAGVGVGGDIGIWSAF